MGNALITVQKEGEDRGSLKIVVIGRLEQRRAPTFRRAAVVLRVSNYSPEMFGGVATCF